MSTRIKSQRRKAKAGSRISAGSPNARTAQASHSRVKATARSTKTNTQRADSLPDAFSAIVKAFANDPEVTPPGVGKGFGSRALKVKGKIFAMISSKSEFVVKLASTRATELVAAGQAKYFDAGRGKAMKEWVAITGDERLWLPLAQESRDFVSAEA